MHNGGFEPHSLTHNDIALVFYTSNGKCCRSRAPNKALIIEFTKDLACLNTLAERTLPRHVFPFTDWDEAKTTSGCYQSARALTLSQSLFGALMWVPGASTQHITSAKLVKVPIHPYVAAQSRFANR